MERHFAALQGKKNTVTLQKRNQPDLFCVPEKPCALGCIWKAVMSRTEVTQQVLILLMSLLCLLYNLWLKKKKNPNGDWFPFHQTHYLRPIITFDQCAYTRMLTEFSALENDTGTPIAQIIAQCHSFWKAPNLQVTFPHVRWRGKKKTLQGSDTWDTSTLTCMCMWTTALEGKVMIQLINEESPI